MQMPHFNALIVADPDSLQAAGQLKMQACMRAEVNLDHRCLDCQVEPITSVRRRTGRQV